MPGSFFLFGNPRMEAGASRRQGSQAGAREPGTRNQADGAWNAPYMLCTPSHT